MGKIAKFSCQIVHLQVIYPEKYLNRESSSEYQVH